MVKTINHDIPRAAGDFYPEPDEFYSGPLETTEAAVYLGMSVPAFLELVRSRRIAHRPRGKPRDDSGRTYYTILDLQYYMRVESHGYKFAA